MEKTKQEQRTSDKIQAILFLNYELIRLENRKPLMKGKQSTQNNKDIKSIKNIIEYLETNRDILKLNYVS